MRVAHFDCIGGVAGDMFLAACIDAGCPSERIAALPERLKLTGVSITCERVKRQGIAATFVRVRLDATAPRKHRHLHHIEAIIDAADLPPRAAADAKRVFQRLAEAEAGVHGTTIQKVHFHEVGADDAIVDIVGGCLALHELGVERVSSSPIPTGQGTVTCEHGVMPIPAPATARLLIGVPIDPVEQAGEMTTPTGAALISTLATCYGPAQSMRIAAIGYGAGFAEWKVRPNLLRLTLGEATAAAVEPSAAGIEHDQVVVLETQVDDMTGQAIAAALERVLEAGALDAFAAPIIMKKGRPGHLLTVLATDATVVALEDVLLRHTTTLGVRRSAAARSKLGRRVQQVETRYGPIGVKLATRGGRVLRAWPEYEDAAAAARSHDVPLAEVQQEALRVWRSQAGDAGVEPTGG
jgi:hypothetical protein